MPTLRQPKIREWKVARKNYWLGQKAARSAKAGRRSKALKAGLQIYTAIPTLRRLRKGGIGRRRLLFAVTVRAEQAAELIAPATEEGIAKTISRYQHYQCWYQ